MLVGSYLTKLLVYESVVLPSRGNDGVVRDVGCVESEEGVEDGDSGGNGDDDVQWGAGVGRDDGADAGAGGARLGYLAYRAQRV